MFCKECGVENQDDSLRCKSCNAYLKSSNSPLDGTDRTKIISFFAFLILPFAWLGTSVIIILIVLFGLYIMNKDRSFIPIMNAKKWIKVYLIALALIIVAIGTTAYYYDAKSINISREELFEEQQKVLERKKRFDYVKNVVIHGSNRKLGLDILMPMPDRNGLFLPKTMHARSVFGLDQTYTTFVPITDDEIDAVADYVANGMRDTSGANESDANVSNDFGANVFAQACASCHGANGAGLKYVAPTLIGKLHIPVPTNEKVQEYEPQNYGFYTILVGVAGLILSLLAVILLMWIFDILFFKPLEEHQDWIVQHGIFADEPNEKSLLDVVKEKIQSFQKQPSCSVADELLKWKSLLDQGVITDEEFNERKEKLLK